MILTFQFILQSTAPIQNLHKREMQVVYGCSTHTKTVMQNLQKSLMAAAINIPSFTVAST